MKTRVMDRVLKQRKARRFALERTAQLKREQAFSVPEIASAHTDYVKAIADYHKTGGSREAVALADEKLKKLLRQYSFEESDFYIEPVCPVCGDSGYAGRKICSCVWEQYISELEIECDIVRRAPFTFKDFNSKAITDQTQLNTLKYLYSKLRKYVDNYPNVKYLNIVLTGATGTGKTCLASAMARAMVKRGNSVKFMSAYEFNSDMLLCHTSPIAERGTRLEDVMECDMLVIDDLGTEPMLKNVTVEYLLMILEERLIKRKITLITSNLSMTGISSRYGERIFSRLSDKKHSLPLEINGNDLRI